MDGSTTLDTLENIKASYAVTLQKIKLRRWQLNHTQYVDK
jgi:hypothetical protein